MTADDAADARFTPRPRRTPVAPAPSGRAPHDAANVRTELARIRRRTELVAASDPSDFTESATNYDVASMAIIRLAALLERPEAARMAEKLTPDEIAAIRTTRNITAHAGYDSMNDELFFTAITERVPAIIDRLLGVELG